MSESWRNTSYVLFVWGLAGAGAVAGSIGGSLWGRAALLGGAIVGGASLAAVAASAGAHWLLARAGSRRRAALGGVIGFAIAAGIAILNLNTPVVPVAATSLAGFGALMGAHWPGPDRAGGQNGT
jgi:hypothetical protein